MSLLSVNYLRLVKNRIRADYFPALNEIYMRYAIKVSTYASPFLQQNMLYKLLLAPYGHIN